jgi:phosphate-selective porin OprO/OprP
MSAVSTALALLLPGAALNGPAPEPAYPAAEAAGPQFELRGLAFADSAWLDGAVAKKRDDAESELRLAELVAVAEFGPFTAIAGYDFSRDGAWRDLGVTWAGDKRWVSVGQFKEPASLDKLTVEGDGPLIETSSLTSAFGLNRRLGVQAGAYGYRWSVTGAAFSGSLDGTDAQGAGPGQSGLAARVTANWETDIGRVHLGAYGRTIDYDGAGVLAASSPNTKLGAKTFYLNLRGANGADSSVLTGLEAAWSRPGLHVSAELARMSFDLPTGDEAATGAYIQASWAITGEQRDYKAKKGSFSGLSPDNPVSEGGIGAVEITARVDRLDFENYNRGRATAYTIGASWTPVEDVRLSANFTAERGSGYADGRDSDVLMVRVQAGF